VLARVRARRVDTLANMAKPLTPRARDLWYGGDYNPEQWPPETWDEDVRLMQAAHFKVATVGVFAWTSLQPAEDRFTFEWLDSVLQKLTAGGRSVVLATPSMAHPAWMSRSYPGVLRADASGTRRHHGRRANYCPNSEDYRRLASGLAGRLAERYAGLPSLVLWHVSNEYGGACYCETCAAAFRRWLARRYQSLDALNRGWWTAFWSHTYTHWDEIDPPYADGETLTGGLTVEYRRFQNESMLECFRAERDAIRRHSTDVPITTNFMGPYFHLDYRTWAPELDVISWDCYPSPRDDPADIAFAHDLNRGLKDGNPFLLMEQTPSAQSWQPVSALKRPGELRRWSYLAVAHGADSVMYFQWRRSRGGAEMFHGAVVEHWGDATARVFREVAAIGEELERIGHHIVGARTPSRVAVLFDWDNWWALDSAVGPIRDKQYVETVRRWYGALWRRNIPVDVVFSDSELAPYDLVIAPMLHMVKPGLSDRVRGVVERGGTFVATVFSGVVDETDLAFEGAPGPLRPLLGIRVEEIDALDKDRSNRIVMVDGGASYGCGRLCEVVRLETAEVVATYGDDFYAGTPVVTRNRLGAGHADYVATEPDDRFLDHYVASLLAEHDIRAPLEAPAGVEIAVRTREGRQLLFVLNHTDEAARLPLPDDVELRDLMSGIPVSGAVELAARDVRVLVTT
jgi:beta-galactosidase